jgi:MSHA biogenesis protein MshP
MFRKLPHRLRGFALVSAIFILVVLAALGGFIATVSTTQHVGSALDVMSARAYQAARAGVEWGLFQTQAAAWCAATPSSDIGPFNGVTVTVACTTVASGNAVEAGLGGIYRITATACAPAAAGAPACPGAAAGAGYVERRLTALVER